MTLKILLPIIVGISIVLQGTLNKVTSQQLGIYSTVLINAFVFFIFCFGTWMAMKFQWMPVEIEPSFSLNQLTITQLIPGFFGFLIVLLVPFSIVEFGPTITFSLVIASQLIFSMFYQSIETKTWPTMYSVIGSIVMFVGVLLMFKDQK